MALKELKPSRARPAALSPPSLKERLRQRRVTDHLTFMALVAACVVFLTPIAMVILVSFKPPSDIVAGSWLFRPTMANYEALLGLRPSEFQFDLVHRLTNSLVAAGGSTLLSLLLGVPAAYAFARLRFRGESVLLVGLILVRMLPPIAMVIPLFVLMRSVGLLDSRVGLIIAYTSFNLPFIVWLMRSFFQDLPSELEEAALVDGAGRWQAFRMVILPLSAPGLVAASIFGLMLAWNDFLFALILTGRNATTLPVMAASFVTDFGVSWGIMMAAGTVIVMPVLLFTLAVQRFLVSGLSGGAVKG